MNMNYEQRRQKLLEDKSGPCMVLIFSGRAPMRSADESYSFSVDRNFYYLTGIERENMILVMTKDMAGNCAEMLYIEPFDEVKAKWVAEYEFLRTIIEDHLIPEDVSIQVLTQSRPHIIQKTFAAIKGAKNVVVHLYNSTSFAQRQQVFRMSEDEIVDIAVSGAKLFDEYAAKMPETNFRFEYSPESFTGTEVEFALRICNAVIDQLRGKEKAYRAQHG